ncbi:DUF4380 domain-containing protein [uncultured Maribacter sp.]|uniref:DUF4380 domain-containing protein n=1 Tax=uncultured Maribacter sp. TaxID=431308 RepID=UPI0030EF0D65|tara:strand:- start:10091 stop:11404 length:1314 start_codon:yes stop_codon:yes gene_type:complete
MKRLRASSYLGWDVYLLENDWMKISIAPQLGGRIIQLELAGHEFLYANKDLAQKWSGSIVEESDGVWRNYGGEKIWPAPQGWDHANQWPGPPDEVLDGGLYSIEERVDAVHGSEAFLVSPVDDFTGLQIQRAIGLIPEKSGVRIKAQFTNFSDRPKKWSIWPVCQLKTEDFGEEVEYQVVCPISEHTQYDQGFKVMHGLVNNPQYRRNKNHLLVDYSYLVGKVGLDTDANWVAYIHKKTGKVLVYRFLVEKNGTYPDNTSVQIWSQGKGLIHSRNRIIEYGNDKRSNPPYLEVEVLSPLVELQPKGSMTFEYEILTSTLSEYCDISDVNEFGIIEDPICVQEQGDGFQLKAKYGVFGKGILKIQLVSSSEDYAENAEAIFQAEVSPITGVSIDVNLGIIEWKKERKIVVGLFDEKNRFMGVLDEFIYNNKKVYNCKI